MNFYFFDNTFILTFHVSCLEPQDKGYSSTFDISLIYDYKIQKFSLFFILHIKLK